VKGDTSRTPVENGAALRQQVAGLAGIDHAQAQVIQLGPGVFDLGADPLVLPANVSLSGAGQHATVITGAVSSAGYDTGAVIVGADRSDIEDLTIRNTGAADGDSWQLGLYLGGGTATYRNVSILIPAGGLGTPTGRYALAVSGPTADATLIDAELRANGNGSIYAYGLNASANAKVTLLGSSVSASNANPSPEAIYGSSATITVRNSSVSGPVAIDADAPSTVHVGASALTGTSTNSVCAASWNGATYAALSATCS
jgi:hypothetical protein